jgi:CheY-like chemotaxis protein
LSVETNFEKTLLNIKGSPIHLKKTIMNLVTNAAEAHPSGGKIVISTRNKYIDVPLKKYEEIREGDYVVLEVSDNGTGITEEDLNRIFEPFYTKKVMGRSGTGLGMAVVWGTVQDHSGYITVESKKGEGTAVCLYFPVTRDPVKEKDFIPIEDYLGNNESILVVDDIKEQREIATNLLTRLNYSVLSVPSGEAAVDYLKTNTADLLLLDMIMDPGMDGLETFRQIITCQPRQKAVIASGYSETDRVKEAQKLGVGQYIKKPYTLEKIGLAVKAELKN